jgi:hypothetical protein
LKDRHRLHCRVQCLSGEVPEDLGPEESLYRSGNLI